VGGGVEAAGRPLPRTPAGVWHPGGVGTALLARLCGQHAQVGGSSVRGSRVGATWAQHAQQGHMPACLPLKPCCPPALPPWAACWVCPPPPFCRLMMASGIRRQRLSSREAAIKALLDEFAAACAQARSCAVVRAAAAAAHLLAAAVAAQAPMASLPPRSLAAGAVQAAPERPGGTIPARYLRRQATRVLTPPGH
jgi:hypothetical protein